MTHGGRGPSKPALISQPCEIRGDDSTNSAIENGANGWERRSARRARAGPFEADQINVIVVPPRDEGMHAVGEHRNSAAAIHSRNREYARAPIAGVDHRNAVGLSPVVGREDEAPVSRNVDAL